MLWSRKKFCWIVKIVFISPYDPCCSSSGAPCGLVWGHCIEGNDVMRLDTQTGARSAIAKKQNLPKTTADLVKVCKRYCWKKGAAGVSIIWDKQLTVPQALQARGCYCKSVAPPDVVNATWPACVSTALEGCPVPPPVECDTSDDGRQNWTADDDAVVSHATAIQRRRKYGGGTAPRTSPKTSSAFPPVANKNVHVAKNIVSQKDRRQKHRQQSKNMGRRQRGSGEEEDGDEEDYDSGGDEEDYADDRGTGGRRGRGSRDPPRRFRRTRTTVASSLGEAIGQVVADSLRGDKSDDG